VDLLFSAGRYQSVGKLDVSPLVPLKVANLVNHLMLGKMSSRVGHLHAPSPLLPEVARQVHILLSAHMFHPLLNPM